MFTFRDRILQVIEKQYDGNQSKFCKAAKVPTSIVNKVVNGDQDFLNGKYLANIHINLGISLNWLFTGLGEMNVGSGEDKKQREENLSEYEALVRLLCSSFEKIVRQGKGETRDQIVNDVMEYIKKIEPEAEDKGWSLKKMIGG